MTAAPGQAIRWGQALWRALFLANSWTWCIGIWLPVYLVGDFGWPGWVAFLVPNVVGAAAMGVVLRQRGASDAVVERHRGAMRAFSVFTVMFHMAFLAWLFPVVMGREGAPNTWYGSAAVGVLLLGVVCSRWKKSGWVALSVSVFLISVGSALGTGLAGPTLAWPPDQGSEPPIGLIYVMPVMCFGFGLCPYLDLTFHRMRAEAPGATGTAAFVLGFGVCFVALMVFSVLYAGGIVTGAGFSYYVLLHIAAQAAFTVGAHLREVGVDGRIKEGVLRPSGAGDESPVFHGFRSSRRAGTRSTRGYVPSPRWGEGPSLAIPRSKVVLLAVVVLFVAGGGLLPLAPDYSAGMSAPRVAYMMFLGAYATVFPAYVWTVMIESRRAATARARILAWLVSCAIAAPMLWAGVVERCWVWLVPAVGAMLVAPVICRVFLRRVA